MKTHISGPSRPHIVWAHYLQSRNPCHTSQTLLFSGISEKYLRIFSLQFLITFLIQKINFWSTCLGGYFVALLGDLGLNLGFLCFPKDFQGFRWFKLSLNLGFLCFSKDFQGFRWFRPGLNLAFLCFS